MFFHNKKHFFVFINKVSHKVFVVNTFWRKTYHEPPPPLPEPPPAEPPPDEDELGDDVIAELAEAMAEFINVPKVVTVNGPEPTYQLGASKVISSNFSIHLSETPKT